MLQNGIAKSVLTRLPLYLEYLLDLKEIEEYSGYVSATKIAQDLELGEVQVRKDLSFVCGNGKPKLGYDLIVLIEKIKNYLGCNQRKNAILVGVGKLGSALLGYKGFERYGIYMIAGFDLKDINESRSIPIVKFTKENLFKMFNQNHVDIGIICVPKKAAQEVCNLLVQMGIKAIWNFAPVRLKVPKNVLVQNENLAYSLSVMSSIINNKNKEERKYGKVN